MPGNRRRKRVAAAVAGVLVLGAGVTLVVHSRGPAASDASHATAQTAPVAERLRLLDNGVRAIEQGLEGAPRDRWDPQYIVQTVGTDPALLFTWVRDHTTWVPYRGMLRGAVGVLMDRQGNALDRAVLLATLIEATGRTVRLARAELPRTQAVALIPSLTAGAVTADAARSASPSADATSPAIQTATSEAVQLDRPVVDPMLERQRGAVAATASALSSRVATQVDRLLRAVPGKAVTDDWTRRLEAAVDGLRDHWWVQVQDGGAWRDFDLIAVANGPTTIHQAPALTSSIAQLPGELRHELVVRVVVEHWQNGALTEARALDHTIGAAEFAGRPLALQIWPGDWPQEVNPDPNAPLGFKDLALQQKQWGATLLAGETALAYGTLASRGEPAPQGGGSGLFGGLGGAIGQMAQGPVEQNREMTATWIEYEIRTPGQPLQTIRRPVFDLLGPAARSAGAPATLALTDDQKLHRSLALMLRAEILPLTSRIAPEYIAHLTARSLVANKHLLQILVRSVASADALDVAAVRKAAAPAVSPLLSLAFARLEWNPFANRVFVDRVGIISRHSHPAAATHGVAMRGATDIVSGDVGVTLAHPDAFAVRVTQGVLDSNAEALWWVGANPMNTAEAYKSPDGWESIAPAAKARVAQLPFSADTRARIASDLDEGLTVVVPPQLVTLGTEQFAGWWRIDPDTGRTTSVSGATTGECGTEYNVTVRAVLLEAAKQFAWESIMCHSMAQAFNEFAGVMAGLQREGYIAWWLPPTAGAADPLQVAKDNAKMCLIGAITKGMLSTTALLPFLISGAAEAETTVALAQARQTIISADAFVAQSRIAPDALRNTIPPTEFAEPPSLRSANLRDTVPTYQSPPTASSVRTGLSEAAAREQVDIAEAATKSAQSEYVKSVNDFMQYRAGGPPPGGWSQELYSAMTRDVALKDSIVVQRINDLRAAEEELAAAAKRARRVVTGPNLYQIAAGQATVARAVR